MYDGQTTEFCGLLKDEHFPIPVLVSDLTYSEWGSVEISISLVNFEDGRYLHGTKLCPKCWILKELSLIQGNNK